jgi:hypothetical protein
MSKPVKIQTKETPKLFVAGTKTKSYNMRIEPSIAKRKRAASKPSEEDSTAQKPSDGEKKLELPAAS